MINNDYLEKLEKEVDSKQKKLQKLSQTQSSNHREPEEKDLEEMFSKEIATQQDIKKFYLKKIETLSEDLFKNSQKQEMNNKRFSELKTLYQQLKEETKGIEKISPDRSFSDLLSKISKGLKKRYNSHRVNKNRSFFELESKKKYLVKELNVIKRKEQSLQGLYKDISDVFPRNFSDPSLRKINRIAWSRPRQSKFL
jgi:small-conductance mechanosensitive channel